MKKVQTLQFQEQLRSPQIGIKNPSWPPASYCTSKYDWSSRGASSSKHISSGVKTRAAKASGVGTVSGAKCGMCMASLGDVSIGCVGCNSMYHTTRICLGLPESVIDSIKEYSDKGINFCCTSCRLKGK